MRYHGTLALLAGIAVLAACSGMGRNSAAIVEDRPGLLARAKVDTALARRTALAETPGGRVARGSIEEENGRLVYSFDIEISGRAGVDEVIVDANTGAVVEVTHETPAEEAKEGS